MEKPITIVINEFRKNIETVINQSGLPWWKIEDELRCNFLPQVHNCVIQEEQVELEMYNKSLAEEESKKMEELREKRVKRSGKK